MLFAEQRGARALGAGVLLVGLAIMSCGLAGLLEWTVWAVPSWVLCLAAAILVVVGGAFAFNVDRLELDLGLRSDDGRKGSLIWRPLRFRGGFDDLDAISVKGQTQPAHRSSDLRHGFQRVWVAYLRFKPTAGHGVRRFELDRWDDRR